MPMPTTLIVLALVLGGCGKDDPKPGAVTAPRPAQSQPAAGLDQPVETVDDTIPEPTSGDGKTAADAGEPDGDRPDGDDDTSDAEEADGPEDGCAPKDPNLKPMQILSAVFTSGIEGKDPRDKLRVARPGQRVYAHLTMRNRSGRKRCLKLTFRVGNKKRTEVTLKIGKSWSWRTWAYNTLRGDDRLPLELTIVDDQDQLLFKKKLPVIPE